MSIRLGTSWNNPEKYQYNQLQQNEDKKSCLSNWAEPQTLQRPKFHPQNSLVGQKMLTSNPKI